MAFLLDGRLPDLDTLLGALREVRAGLLDQGLVDRRVSATLEFLRA